MKILEFKKVKILLTKILSFIWILFVGKFICIYSGKINEISVYLLSSTKSNAWSCFTCLNCKSSKNSPGGGVFCERITHKFHNLNAQRKETKFWREKEKLSTFFFGVIKMRDEGPFYSLSTSSSLWHVAYQVSPRMGPNVTKHDTCMTKCHAIGHVTHTWGCPHRCLQLVTLFKSLLTFFIFWEGWRRDSRSKFY